MRLKLTRSQRRSLTGKTIFQLDVRADISERERELVRHYKLGKQLIYSSKTHQALAGASQAANEAGKALSRMDPVTGLAAGAASHLKGLGLAAASRFALTISIDDLTDGKSIETKDLAEMLEAEEAVVTASQNLKSYLDAAETFDGREVVVEI